MKIQQVVNLKKEVRKFTKGKTHLEVVLSSKLCFSEGWT